MNNEDDGKVKTVNMNKYNKLMNIINGLTNKRFCLPDESDMDKMVQNNKLKDSAMGLSDFNHIAVVFKDMDSICSYGFNKLVPNDARSIHAEQDALMGLKPNKYRNRKKAVNIMVVRISRMGKLQSSKPCMYCIEAMMNTGVHRGYKINKVFYSNSDETISYETLYNMHSNPNKHVSSYFRKLVNK